jgi:NAD+ synthase (glutamine-hydrolysing)
MQLVKVAAGALNQTPLDWEGNKSRILSAVAAARDAGVSVLCLPELCITGYGCEDAFFSPGLQRTAIDVLFEIAPQTHGLIVAVGLPLVYDGVVYNTACLLVDGRVAGFVAKQFLAGDGIHYEPRWFRPWPAGRHVETRIAGEMYPLGDIHFQCGGVKIGFEICEDAWVAARPGRRLARRGVDLILNPSASHFAFGKTKVREQFVLEAARSFGVSYVYSNLLGNEAGRAIYDGNALIASSDRVVGLGKRFSFADFSITSAVIDLDAARLHRGRATSVESDPLPAGDDCIAAPFAFPEIAPAPQRPKQEPWETGLFVKQEEFARAVALALFDYLRKSRSQGFVVSISGGADSAAVTCLVGLMVRLGVAELGLEGFVSKLAHIPALRSARRPADIVRSLLACVYQATQNSSETTQLAARAVAEAVGAEYFVWDVEALVRDYVRLVGQAIGRELTWQTDDIALQNIQARVRAPGVWLLANLRSALLLATSNRSEAAVGYTTMDGDTCGGLSPIAGIDKAFLRQWLTWMETSGPVGLGPIPALAAVNVQAPTAELRPAAAAQTDEADLMPYELLDGIERAAIRDKQTPLEVFKQMSPLFPQYDVRQLAQWVERFFNLWCRNQWKRERYAPSFHLDDENLDPKTWCRFPILSGGYERELAELRSYVASLAT